MSGTRRRWRALLAVALAVAAAAASLAVLARLAPGRARVALEQRLGDALGTPVEVASVRFAPALGLALEAHGLRARATAETGGAGLSAERLRVELHLPGLLRGRLRVGRLAIAGLRVDAEREASGRLRPEVADRLVRALGATEPAAANEVPAARGRVAAVWESAAGLPAIDVEDAVVRLRTLDAEGRPAGEPIALEARLSVHRARLRRTLELATAGRFARGDEDGARFELAGSLGSSGEARATLTVDGLALDEAQRLLPRRAARPTVTGHASGRIDWSLAGDGASHVEAGIELGDLRVRGRLGRSKQAIDARWPSARASASLEIRPSAIDAQELALDLGELELEGRARVGLPWRAASPVDLELRAAPFDAVALRNAARKLVPASAEALRRYADALEAGRIGPVSLRAPRTTRGELEAFARAPLAAWPRDLALELSAADLGVRLGGGDPLRSVSGRLSWGRDRLALSDVHASLGDRPLPVLDLTVEGVAAAAAALAAERVPAPVAPLPGRLALDEWIESQRKPGQPPRWKRADVDADWIEHPVLLRPLEQVRATLWPGDPGIRAEVLEARWGGVPVSGVLRVEGGSPGRLSAQVRAALPAQPPSARPDPEAWARGRIRVDLEKLGPLRASSLVARVRAVGARAELREGDAVILPRGRVTGAVDFDFSRREDLPYQARLRIVDGSLPDLMEDVGLGGEFMTGSADLAGEVAGRFAVGRKFLAEVTGPASIRLRDGEILRRMHLMLAIAAASDTLNPFRSREKLPYQTIEGELELEHGTIRAKALSLTGPAVRLVATGTVDAVEAPYPLQAVVGIFFFRTLDTVLSKMPLVNRLLLGRDDNLVAAYFALTGPWAEPQARVIPTRTLLTSGPAGIVTEGLPAFVRSGLTTLQRLLGAEAEPTPPDPFAADAPMPPDAGGAGAPAPPGPDAAEARP